MASAAGVECDIAILGGGPAGYVAALHAARNGAAVVLIEKDKPGGTCLHRGCIPTKAILQVAGALDRLRWARGAGVVCDGLRVDLAGLRQHRDRAVRTLAGGVRMLLADAGVEVLAGEGWLAGAREVAVRGDAGGGSGGSSGGAGGGRPGADDRASADWLVKARRAVIIATGSLPAPLPLPAGERVEGLWDSDQALRLSRIPEHLVIIGGGAVGLEFATVYKALGSAVTVIEYMPRLLWREDPELGRELEASLNRRGIEVLTGFRVVAAERSGDGGVFTIQVEGRSGEGGPAPGGALRRLEADAVLVATGRRPAVSDIGLEAVGLKPGWIEVDGWQETAVPGIYACGDVTGMHLLAHAAAAQGVNAVDRILERPPSVRMRNIPSCVHTIPEVASVGLTEEMCRRDGIHPLVGRFPFSANGMAVAAGEREGFVKVLAEPGSRRIIGAQAMGYGACALIHEVVAAMAGGVTVDGLASTIHAHPTVNEALVEACQAVFGQPLHLPVKR